MKIHRLGAVFVLASSALACGDPSPVPEGPVQAASAADTADGPAALGRVDHLRFCWNDQALDETTPLVEAVIRHTLEDRSELRVRVDGIRLCADDPAADVAIYPYTYQRQPLPIFRPQPNITLRVDVLTLGSIERTTVHGLAMLFGAPWPEPVTGSSLDPSPEDLRAMRLALSPAAAMEAPAATLVPSGGGASQPLAVGQRLTVCSEETVTLAGGRALRVCSGRSEECVFAGPVYHPKRPLPVEVVTTAIGFSRPGLTGTRVALTPGRHVIPASAPIASLLVPASLRATLCTRTDATDRAISVALGDCRRVTGASGGVVDVSSAFTSPVRLIVVENAVAGDVERFRPAMAIPQVASADGPSRRVVATLEAGTCADGAPSTRAGSWTAYRQFRGAPSPWGDTQCIYEWKSSSAVPDVDSLRRYLRASRVFPYVEKGDQILVCTNGACDPGTATLLEAPPDPHPEGKPGCDVCGGEAFNGIAFITVNPADRTPVFHVRLPGITTLYDLPNTGAASYVITGQFGPGHVLVSDFVN
jgi:hypothetical protein